jgi:site-specific DNA-methyltransferase (adenine-specific)
MNINVIEGDAIYRLKEIDPCSVDVVIADPPYNLGKNYGNNHDKKSFDDYIEFSYEWIKEAHRILKDSGTIYTFMGVRFISYLFSIMERECSFIFNSWITWHYTQGIGKTKGFSPRHDDILMFTKTQKYNFYIDNIRVPQKYYRSINNMRGANPGDVWSFSHVHYCNTDRLKHPTQKPEGLIERMVLASSKEGDTVVDPFSGSGTTLRVCQQLNRNCIGIELNPEYVQMAKIRLKQPFTGFDSIDERMMRIPNDINDNQILDDYLSNHKDWFLKNHPDAITSFENELEKKYRTVRQSNHQLYLFDNYN